MTSKIAKAVDQVRATLAALPKKASLSAKAQAIAGLGHPAWFAVVKDGHCALIANEGGSRWSTVEASLTTDLAKLAGRVAGPEQNSIAFDVRVQGLIPVRHILHPKTDAIEPWRIKIDASTHRSGTGGALVAPTPTKPSPATFPAIELSDAKSAVQRALRAVDTAHEVRAAATKDHAEMSAALITDRANLAAMRDALSRRLTEDVLNNVDIKDDYPETRKIRTLERRIAATENALPVRAEARRRAEIEFDSAKDSLVRPVLDYVASLQRDALSRTSAAVAHLVPHVTELLAIDELRRSTLGDLFRAPAEHPGLVAAGRVAAKGLRTLPPLIRADNEIDTEAVTARVHELQLSLKEQAQ